MDCVLVTFLYPKVFDALPALIENINQQTKVPSAVIFFCDEKEPSHEILNKLECSYSTHLLTGTPLEIRIKGLHYLKSLETELFILHDADDLMSLNRIELCSSYPHDFDILVNDLDLISENDSIITKNCWNTRLSVHSKYTKHDIATKNFIGFGNTAIKSTLLKESFIHSSKEIIAGDWFVFSQICDQKDPIIRFTDECTTLYKIHTNNIAGIKKNVQEHNAEAKVVSAKHHAELKKINITIPKTVNQSITNNQPSLENCLWWEII